MKIAYLCARYSRFPEMQRYRDDLAIVGYSVPARWIKGEHEKIDGIATREQTRQFALDDLEDLRAAELVISFTEDPTGNAEGRGRGGRHVEFGMAHALGKRLIVVGFHENVFHDLPSVEFFGDWGECWEQLSRENAVGAATVRP
jgi:hypothetical protein